jgi:hypothetical protein
VNDYKIRALPTDPKKRETRWKELGITEPCVCNPCKHTPACESFCNGCYECEKYCAACDEYKVKSLPSHIQLAEKIRRRGKTVQVGSRMEYIVCYPEDPEDRLFNKIEDPEYQQEHSDKVKIDPLYYLNLMINPFDEALEVGFKLEHFIKKQYKNRLNKFKLIREFHKVKEYNKGSVLPNSVKIYNNYIRPKCKHPMTSGVRKGQLCKKNCKIGLEYCTIHIKKYNDSSQKAVASESIITPNAK